MHSAEMLMNLVTERKRREVVSPDDADTPSRSIESNQVSLRLHSICDSMLFDGFIPETSKTS